MHFEPSIAPGSQDEGREGTAAGPAAPRAGKTDIERIQVVSWNLNASILGIDPLLGMGFE